MWRQPLKLVALGLAACSPDVLPRAAEPASSVSAPSASSATTASVPLATAAEPPAPPEPVRLRPVTPPERLPDFDPELVKNLGPGGVQKLEIAASVCAAAVRRDQGKLRVGCRSCPPFDASNGPDGKVVLDPPGDDGFYELEAAYEGSFTRAGKREAAAVFAGCEPHSSNWGGTLLVERTDKVWVSTSYRSGFHPLRCQAFPRPDSRSMLVCLWETDHQSYAHWLLDTYDFSLGSDEDPEAGWKNLLSLDDNSYAACWDGPGFVRDVVADLITDFRLTAATAGSPAKLLVDARFSHGPPTPAYLAKCRALEREGQKENPKPVNLRAALQSKRRQLVFLWDGQTFSPDDATKAFFKGLGLSANGALPE